MDTVSLSDIAAVTRGNDNDGWAMVAHGGL